MATTTASVMISDALKEIGVIGEGETPSTTMYADGLRMLNRLLDTLSHKATFSFDSTLRTLALTGQSSFDIGPTGDIVTLRPIKITSAYATLSGIDYAPINIISLEQYDALPLKTSAGSVPEFIAYNGVFPDGVVYVYPVCTCTIKLRTIDLVKTFATTSTQIDMPEGYEDYIMLSLAIRMAPGYQVQVNPDTRTAAKRAAKLVERTNRVIPTMCLPSALTGGYTSSLAAIQKG